MFSKHSQSLKVLMMLTVSMTISHLCQNLEIVKGVRRLLKVLIIATNAPSHSVVSLCSLCVATHTDQYLSFQSYHPLQHKRAVIRTLLERCDSIVMEEEDRKQEEEHITALHTCGYPDWAKRGSKSK